MIASWTELLGAALGLINIGLLVRRSVWNFPAAMASVLLVGVTLFQARLYSESGLQAFFFMVNMAGWYQWSRASNAHHAVPVRWMSAPARLGWAAVTVLLSVSLGWAMHRFTNAALPFADSAVTGASIAAQLLLNNRKIENWVLWIGIDVVSVALYLNRELYLFAALYVIFLAMSVIGLRQWVTSLKPLHVNQPA